MLVEVHETPGDAQHRPGLLLAGLVVLALRHAHRLLEVRRRLLEPPVGRVDLPEAVQRVAADRLEGVGGELRVWSNLPLLLGSVQMVLEADAARLQVPLRGGGDAQVPNCETLRVLRSHSVGVLDGVLVVDRCVLWEVHGLEYNSQVRVRDQPPGAVGQLQVLVVVLDRLVVVADLERVDAQAIVGQGLALGVFRSDAQRQELLVLLDRLLIHALIVQDDAHLVISLQSLMDVPGAARRVREQLQVRQLLPEVHGPRAGVLRPSADPPHVIRRQGHLLRHR
mmetsp:Transcript_100737/g.291232  ORF Transcript_100737/g.291232 Transcript_100737/m.291232 type:complete len:281 (+) Transcript_100737:182-1024(+)